MQYLRFLGAAAMVAGCLSFLPGTASAAVNGMDRIFVTKAGQGGLGEVAAGNLARSKNTSPAVRRVASRMVADHSKANVMLANIAAREGMSVPSRPGPDDRMMMARLRLLNGAAFDGAYLKGQETAHVQTIALFRREMSSGADRRLVMFARMTLPTLQMHLSMIQRARMNR